MKKVLGTIFIIAYSIIAIAVTVLLLSFNEYMCSEINGYTLYIVRDETLDPHFKKGDLIVIKQTIDEKIQEGDKLFLYQNITSNEYRVKYGEFTGRSMQAGRLVYTIDNEFQFDATYLIGTENGTLVYSNLGTILGVLESRWGYLFFIVVVTLLLFLEELYELFMEIKYGNETDEEEEEIIVKKPVRKSTTQSAKQPAKQIEEQPKRRSTRKVEEQPVKRTSKKVEEQPAKRTTKKVEGQPAKRTTKKVEEQPENQSENTNIEE